MKNLDDKVEDILLVNINPEWFSYHLLIANTYIPEFDVYNNVNFLLNRLNKESTEMIINNPDISPLKLDDCVQYNVSKVFSMAVKNSSYYNKINGFPIN